MKVQPSSVTGVELTGSDAASFLPAVEALYGRAVDDVLRPALRYSVIVRNGTARAIAFLGTRFDMIGVNGKPFAVVHYADTLRHPEKADLTEGAARFVCAEPAYSELVLRQENAVSPRSVMNLNNLRKILSVRASLDCAAFDDGEFAGPDSNGAFDRLERERQTESALVAEILEKENWSTSELENLLSERKGLARQLLAGLQSAGLPELLARARDHRCRIPLWRRHA